MTIDTVAATMAVAFEFDGLIGTLIAAHIHGPTAEPRTGTAGWWQDSSLSGHSVGGDERQLQQHL